MTTIYLSPWGRFTLTKVPEYPEYIITEYINTIQKVIVVSGWETNDSGAGPRANDV